MWRGIDKKLVVRIEIIMIENRIIVVLICICFGCSVLRNFFLNFVMIVFIYLVMSLFVDFNMSKVMGILSKEMKMYIIWLDSVCGVMLL